MTKVYYNGEMIEVDTNQDWVRTAFEHGEMSLADAPDFKTMDVLQIDNYNRAKRGELIGE